MILHIQINESTIQYNTTCTDCIMMSSTRSSNLTHNGLHVHLRLPLLLAILLTHLCSVVILADQPSVITIRAGVLHAPPFAVITEETDEENNQTNKALAYGGLQPDLLQRMQIFAQDLDNVTLKLELSPSPSQYGAALDLVANDCNTTENPNNLADCRRLDVIVGDYYCNPDRSMRVDFTPSFLRTTMSTVKYKNKRVLEDITTLTQAASSKATVCVPDGTYLMSVVMEKFPNVHYLKCDTQEGCLKALKAQGGTVRFVCRGRTAT